MIRAVVFDLDGVLLDSEHLWDESRRAVAAANGGRWHDDATAAMQGMSSVEWSLYMRDELGVDLETARITDLVVGRLLERYEQSLPMLPGADDAVRRTARRWPLGLATSANRVVIDAVLEMAGLGELFAATVSSEEVPRGKPAPDVYVEAARRMGLRPEECAAIEDSASGLRSALAAGLRVAAVPNPAFPPSAEVLARAQLVVGSLDELTVEALERLDEHEAPIDQRLDEEEDESFPASDPHAEWAGPST